MAPKHIFGPVLSRRLGLSLGIDLVPYKTCTFNCAYCECGSDPFTTVTRQDFFPPGDVIAELETVLASRPHLDSITFAGSGEPTLSRSIGQIISWVKHSYPEYTVSVLTNGSLLTDAGVREELLAADRVIPTLTSVFQPTFERIHHPHPLFRIDTIIEGMVQFRKQYTGALWLEVFVVPGVNTSDTELEGLKLAIGRIEPDLIQLNTLDRPAPEDWVAKAGDAELERVRNMLGMKGIEIAGRKCPLSPETRASTDGEALISATLSRRPSTVEDLIRSTVMSGGDVTKILGKLEREGKVTSQRGTRGVFYTIMEKTDDRENTE